MASEAERKHQVKGYLAGDPLRAVAALWIVVYHVCANAVARTAPEGVGADLSTELGEFGFFLSRAIFSVFLFFGLSGYLLSRPYLHALMNDRPRPSPKPYFRNRALRILPIFWLVVLVTLLVRGRRGEGWSEVLVVPLFAQVYDPSKFSAAIPQAWTLDVELIFYVALPLTAWVGAKLLPKSWGHDRRGLAILGFLIAGAALSLYIRNTRTTWPGLISMPAIWFSFAAGVAVANVEPLLRDRIQTERAGRIAATAVGLAGLGILASFIWRDGSLWSHGVEGFLGVFCLLLAPLILQWTTGTCWRFLYNRPMRWIGERSYSFYLWHVLVIYLLTKPVPEYPDDPVRSVIVLMIPSIAISLAVSALSYRYVEMPFLTRKHSWRRSEEAQPGEEKAGAPVATGPEVKPGTPTLPERA